MADHDYRNVFGFPDAALATDTSIVEDHLIQAVESRLKWSTRNGGRSIIVGIKGCGKTDLRRFIDVSDHAKALVVNLNCNTGYFNLDTTKINMKSGRIKNALALQLLGVFAEVIPSSASKAEKVKGALKSAAGTVADVGKRIGLSAEIDLKFAQIDLSKLAASEHTGLVKDTWDDMFKKVSAALAGSSKRGYILIDDVEDVFPGIEKNPDFMEGLARAVTEINQAFGSRLHVLLFVKYGIWRFWYDNQREYDKVTSDIEMISWNPSNLVDLIARRIALRLDLDREMASSDLWAAMFQFDQFDEFTRHFTSVCVNGPRDIIDLCNRCAENAQGAPISVGHLQAVLAGYSEAKMNGVGADFGDVYPDIEKFARQILQGCKSTMKAQALASLYDQKVVDDQHFSDVFGDHTWFKVLSSSQFAAKMYEIGIVGIEDGDHEVYAIEAPNRTPLPRDGMVIHPAFRSNLNTG